MLWTRHCFCFNHRALFVDHNRDQHDTTGFAGRNFRHRQVNGFAIQHTTGDGATFCVWLSRGWWLIVRGIGCASRCASFGVTFPWIGQGSLALGPISRVRVLLLIWVFGIGLLSVCSSRLWLFHLSLR